MKQTTIYSLGKMKTPFVQVFLSDKKTGEKHERLMLLDSCCVTNILVPHFIKQTNLKPEDSDMELEAFGNSKITTRECTMPFELGGEKMEETFFIADTPVFDVLPDCVIGVLGSNFLRKRKLAIDFGRQKLYRSRLQRADYQRKNISFAFDFGEIIHEVKLPMLIINLPGGKGTAAMVDTGATDNVFSSEALAESGLKHEMLESTDTLSFVTGNCEVRDAKVEFSLFSELDPESADVHSDTFKVIKGSRLIAFPEGSKVPSPYMLLGARFLWKQKFVLDFATNLLFRFAEDAASAESDDKPSS